MLQQSQVHICTTINIMQNGYISLCCRTEAADSLPVQCPEGNLPLHQADGVSTFFWTGIWRRRISDVLR